MTRVSCSSPHSKDLTTKMVLLSYKSLIYRPINKEVLPIYKSLIYSQRFRAKTSLEILSLEDFHVLGQRGL